MISVCARACVCVRVFTAIEYRYAARVVLVVEVPQVCAQYHAIFHLIEQYPERKREGEGKLEIRVTVLWLKRGTA